MELDCGFQTIGNATLIFHDGKPVLCTDPWFEGSAYFGSWGLSHRIPEEQRKAILDCEFVWLSHGHPDHLSGDSVALLRNKKILLPDHEGGRVRRDLEEQGFDVHVLPDKTWLQVSPRIRVFTIADYNQDGILIADVNGRLVVNLNDASDHGWATYVRKVVKDYQLSYLLSLAGFGDADMANMFDEAGQRLPEPERSPLGKTLSKRSEYWGTNRVIPFSAMHRYQRSDSAWANSRSATLEDYADGFDNKVAALMPAFAKFNCLTDQVEEICPPKNEEAPHDPKEFGDDWTEQMDPQDVARLRAYFQGVDHLRENLDFLRFTVGGKEEIVELKSKEFKKGITFEVPKNSLMTAVKFEVFDDLLIGNFMKATLHGEWGPRGLYPDFTPYVAKYADNGRAKTAAELRAYHGAYFRRDPTGYLRHRLDAAFLMPLQAHASNFLRSRLGAHSTVFNAAKKAFWAVKRKVA